MERKVLPPTYLLIAGAAMVVLDGLLPLERLIYWPWTSVGIAIATLGILIALLAHREFTRVGTTIKPFELSSSLVQSGPFRLSRNPMYLGMVLILLGLLVWLGSLGPVIVPPLFVLLIHHRFVRHEEVMMEMQFRSDYLDYKKRVRRWI